jgi:uncharacterized protein (DUF2235 family)
MALTCYFTEGRQTNMTKNIVVYSDGTGQDGGVRPEQRVSNVYKLYRASRVSPDNCIDPNEQVAFYDPGLGTDIGATALTAPVRFVQKLLASVTGRGVTTNIADCYEFIINHYQPGDRILLIGFSRGAYTARCVANLLRLCGVSTKTPSGPLMRFRKAVRDIADEAVNEVLEHGAGHPRAEFEAERDELARRFRRKYGSNATEGSDEANAAPYFIGVFDTVAALGAQGLRRLLIQTGLAIGFAIGTALLSALPVAVVAGLSNLLLDTQFWWTALPLWAGSVLAASVWWWHRQKESYRKTIRDFPNPGDVHSHYAEWKGANFDRLLSRHVHYARSANAIDEQRKDFDRVGWGGVQSGASDTVDGHTRLIQLWFAGNHSDVGGSYSEVESRLSDIALQWMIEQATVIPSGLKIGPVFVHGNKLPGTGEQGTALNLYPSADVVQHDEMAGMRDTLDQRAEHLPSFLRGLVAGMNYERQVRTIRHDAPLHPTVKERFKLNSVVQVGGSGPYRPEALQGHDDLKEWYPALEHAAGAPDATLSPQA